MRNKKLTFFILASVVLFGANVFADSEDMVPTDLTPAKQTFVLGTGSYDVYCQNGGGYNCHRQVTNKQCPVGYNPSVTVGFIGGGADFITPIRKIYLDNQPKIMPSSEGYQLALAIGYSAGSSLGGGGTDRVTINYTVYCG